MGTRGKTEKVSVTLPRELAGEIRSMVSQGEVIIHNAESVTVSYPGFWDELERITG